MARVGTTTAFGRVVIEITTLTNCPGQRRRLELAKVAFSLMEPVDVSTVLSRKVMLPDSGFPSSPVTKASTLIPFPRYLRRSTMSRSGTEKVA